MTVKPTNPATTLKGLSTAHVQQNILGTAQMVKVNKLLLYYYYYLQSWTE